jgi:hypothetical protein
MAIITSSDMAGLQDFDLSAYDPAAISTAVSATCAQIERYCGRTFDSALYTETLDGNGLDQIFTEQYPITAVTSVTLDSEALTAGTDSDNYTALTNSLYREGKWSAGRRNLVVVYAAGYSASTMPADLKYIAMRMTAELLRSGGQDAGVVSERIDNYSYTLREGATSLTGAYESDLEPFRRVAL